MISDRLAHQITIRPYRESDWLQLCEIHDASRKDELAASGLSAAFLTLEQTAENESLFDGEVIVAASGETVLGFAAFSDNELTWLYCHPRCYRQGVGRALLKRAIEANGGALGAEVLVGNDAALNLYLSEGFKIVRKVDGKLAGNESFAASGYVLEHSHSTQT